MKVTKDLKDTLELSSRIQKVYVNKKGEHFFHLVKIEAREIFDERQCSIAHDVIEVCPGVSYEPREFKDSKPLVVRRVPVKWEEPIEVFTREEILNAEIDSELIAGEVVATPKKGKKK